MIVRFALALLTFAATAALAGCGGEKSEYTEDEIATALELRFEGADDLYESSEGSCIVTAVLISSDEVEEAKAAGELESAVAATSDGSAGVVFGGVTSVDPETCAEDATSDLESLGS